MEDRFIILAWRGNGSNVFYESYSHDDVLMLTSDLKEDEDVEHIEIIPVNTYAFETYKWSNPNSNPES